MEFAAAICFILIVLVWYYGNSLKAIQKNILKYNMLIHIELAGIKVCTEKMDEKIELQSYKINDLIEDALHSGKVEWDFFNKEKVDSILNKLDEIQANTNSLGEIHGTLGEIEREVLQISSHPAFTWNHDDDD